jgi:DNA-binding NtrC family response regulator
LASRGRILVVDDEPSLRGLIARGLRERGHEAVEVADGLSAVDAVRSASAPFDLVITNSRMPHLSGSKLVECLREIHPELPIIHVSGSHGMRYDHPVPPDIPTIFKPFKLWDLIDEAEKLMQP